MPSLKEVRARITSVNSTQQITKAMKMVAAAKLRRAQDAIVKIRPYANKLNDILQSVSASVEDQTSNPYSAERAVERVLLVAVTSDRGLAGAFNANVIKSTLSLINEDYASQFAKGNGTVLCIGKKGQEFFARREYNLISDFTGLFGELSFENVKKAAELSMEGFVNGTYDKVVIIYNEFKNVATQVTVQQSFLPITSANTTTEIKASKSIDYTFEPNEAELLQELIPKSLKVTFYKCVLDSNASEHGARMTAMDKATDNAKELLKALRLEYNRSRQASITKEILEIVGGAEALNG